MKHALLISLCLLLSVGSLRATHNIGGEITYEVVNPQTYEYRITLTTYTDSRSRNAHRNEVDIFFGYGDPEKTAEVPASIEKEPVASFIWRNVYVVNHKFPGPGCYTVKFTDPNRVKDILNINDSFSVNIPFYLESEICIRPELGEGGNNSPRLLEMPISYACVGYRYEHNPNAYDVDGDSLTYTLVPPRMEEGKQVPRYISPVDVPGNGGARFSLDYYTGELVWDVPKRQGKYNIAIRIDEFRRVETAEGVQMRNIGYVVRDMQIIVEPCNNDPPILSILDDTCVVAGTGSILQFTVSATDPNVRDNVHLSASGGPFEVPISPATFQNKIPRNTVNSEFRWEIDCSHIRKEPYSVVFNATDEGNGVTGRELTDLEYMAIQVIGPEPLNLSSEAIGNGIALRWDAPVCDGVVAYFIYRRANPSNWNPDFCETGVPDNLGFRRVGIVEDLTDLSFYDNNNGEGLEHGLSYCYRVTALYRPEGQFSQIEGRASGETCAELKRDVPIITTASVLETDDQNGKVEIAWASPIELDSFQYPGPYRYELMESDDLGGNNLVPIANFRSDFLKPLMRDTTYLSEDLNTRDNPYSYTINFYFTNPLDGEEERVGASKTASTPYLLIEPAFRQLTLKVDTDVPWENDTMVVYRQNAVSGDFDSIGYSTEMVYTDYNLTNGEFYCYKVKTIGSFNTDDILDPVLNFSQESCAQPRDTIPPCPPVLEAEADCDFFRNLLDWQFEDGSCASDVIAYYVYFQNLGVGDFVRVDTLYAGPSDQSFIDDRDTFNYSLAGCYRVTAIDSYYNESKFSNTVCVDNCPQYRLPNVFTPGDDDRNDFFRPFPDYRFIDSMEIVIRNRWGLEVFRTSDPNINWDGTDQNTGKPLAAGVYYYVCKLKYIRLKHLEDAIVTGTVQILR